MRLLAAAAVLSAFATSFVAPAQGSPPVDAPEGRRCQYVAMADPDPAASPDALTGAVNGGPLSWHREFWLHCHVRVDNNTHAGPAGGADAHAASLPQDGDPQTREVAVLADRIDYISEEDSQDYLCTSVSWPTATGPNWLYWTPGNNGRDTVPGTTDDVPDRWTADPAEPCVVVPIMSTAPLFDGINTLIVGGVDPRTCAVFARLHTVLDPAGAGPQPGDVLYVDAEGDVFLDDGDGIREADWRDDLWYDCPGYVDWNPSPAQPAADGTPVIDSTGGAPPQIVSSVLGYVTVTMSPGDTQPTVTLAGELAVPALWSCTSTPYVATQPFTVTCDPVPVGDFGWECGVVHADVTTTSTAGRARAALYCDADGTPEVRTHTVTGVGGHDTRVAPSTLPARVTQWRCTVSNGAGAAPVPGFAAGCGDPGAVRVE